MLDTSNWKEFRIGDLFDSENGNVDIKKEHINGKGLPVVSSGVDNQGIIGLSDINAKVHPAHTITVDMFGNVYYRDVEYKMVTHARVFSLIPNEAINKEIGNFLSACILKITSSFEYNNMCSYKKIKDLYILLPVTPSGEPDWDFMTSYIAELEEEHVAELEAYLVSTGLDDYELTEEDRKVLSASPEWGEFRIGDLFEVFSPKKRFNANAVKFDGNYPYVARGSSNNGIRGYITEDIKYLNPANSLSFGQDTATIYYQPEPYFTGDKIKVMVLRDYELNEILAAYFVTTISKAFSDFSWGQNSFNENVIKNTLIKLPILPDGTPDFEHMEKYIKAIEKIKFKNAVEWKNKKIEATKQLITSKN